MGAMRRVESSIESAVDGPNPKSAAKPVKRRDRDKAPSVQSKELGQKLIKELEDHKVTRQDRTLVSNRFTLYLCPQDYDRFAPRMEDLVTKLERTVIKHVRSRRYELAGDLEVVVVREPELRSGYFGILAQRGRGETAQPQSLEIPQQQPAAVAVAGAGAGAAPRSKRVTSS